MHAYDTRVLVVHTEDAKPTWPVTFATTTTARTNRITTTMTTANKHTKRHNFSAALSMLERTLWLLLLLLLRCRRTRYSYIEPYIRTYVCIENAEHTKKHANVWAYSLFRYLLDKTILCVVCLIYWLAIDPGPWTQAFINSISAQWEICGSLHIFVLGRYWLAI